MNQPRIIGGRYEILNFLGRGGIATVYKGRDTRTGETVAIKVLKPGVTDISPEMVQRFINEGEVLRRLNHPSIVKVLDSIEEDDQRYIIMEYISGGDLKALADSGKLSTERILSIALDLSDALVRAHRLKIVHRDIKPSNVLLADDGTPRLSDFGVAHFGDAARITQTGDMIGTLAYLSPEGCIGEDLDTRADIWSFGITLYELLAGRRPFKEENGSVALLMSILQDPITPLETLVPGIHPALATLILRMLDKDRETRIGSFRLVGAQLEAIMNGREIPTELDDDHPPKPTENPPEAAPPSQPVIPLQIPITKRRIEGPPRIYISYVRSDTATIADRIYQRMAQAFGEENVVKDLEHDGMVENVVASSNVLLAVVGREWENVIRRTSPGNPDDCVRLEVETGLSRDNVLVIPVFVDGALITGPLPDRLHDLIYRSAVVIEEDQDLSTLVATVKNSFDVIPAWRLNPLWLVGIGVVLVLVVLVVLSQS